MLDGRECITLYAKDYDRSLGKVFGDAYKNDTDTMTDYFDTGHVRIFATDANYPKAQAAMAKLTASREARHAKRNA